MLRRLRLILWLAVALAGAGYFYLNLAQDHAGHNGHDAESHNAWANRDLTPGPRLDFTLQDENGRTVSPASFEGKHLLVFFGFTHCPDICPASLAQMDAALGLVGNKAEKVQALFITVDPERDTAAVLRNYLAPFEGRILGLTGNAESIRAAAKNFGVYFEKRSPESDGSYIVDHIAAIFLARPDGEYISHGRHNDGPESLAKMIETHISP